MKLYAFATPNNLKPVILLEELGVNYDLQAVNIRQGAQKTDAFVALNPNAKVPVLVDTRDDGREFVLTESAAILVYLAEKHSHFLPVSPTEKARVWEQLFFHASGIGPAYGNSGYFQKLAPEPVPMAIARFQGEAERVTGVLNGLLAQHEYTAGEAYTIADMAHFGWLWRSAFAGITLANYPHVARWYAQVAARPAVLAAIAKIEALVPPAV
jgi:GSH-dependent disulfide-bond oxidoreductase